MNKTEMIRQHFENEAKEFDKIILKLIPFYNEMTDALVLALPFHMETPIRVMDLGCGTGTITKLIKDSFPNAKIDCLDVSEKMLQMAEVKLKNCSEISFTVGDFNNFEFTDTYDVIVSSLALHHLVTEEEKRMFYSKIYSSLSNGGVFYNADVVLGSNEHLQRVYIEKWKEFMSKSVTLDEIENKWLKKYKEEDSPSELINQIKWLEEIGFKHVDIIWKYYNYGVYGGQK
jgi:tRNA (cmo5U34)-methyltransferase